MNRGEFQTERTRIISEMLDNPDEYGIYPTTKCFEQLDALFDSLSLPPAKGAVPDNAAEQNKRMREWFKERTGLDDTLLSIHMEQIDVMLKGVQQQPTAEGAEEIFTELEFVKLLVDNTSGKLDDFEFRKIVNKRANEFATLHAQRIADKMVEERLREELIRYIKWYGGFNYEDMTDEMLVNEYLKSRESHE